MENPETNSRMKIYIVGGVVFFILVIIVVILAFSKPATRKTSNIEPNSSGSTSQGLPTSTQVNPGVPTSVPQVSSAPVNPGWVAYGGRLFALNYPPGYTTQQSVSPGANETLIISSNNKNTRIEIQAYPSSSTSVDKIVQIFSGLGYKQSPQIIGNNQASRFDGSILINQIKLNETAIVFENKGMIYKIQLSYNSDQPDNSIQQTFEDVASSFHLL